MIKKILLLATVAFSLLISGCEQPLPPTDNPPKVDNPTDKPEKPPVKPVEKPPVKPAEKPDNEPPKTIPADTQAQKISVKVYYPDDAGINLVAVKRTVEVKSDAEKYLAAVNLLMDNPNEKDLTVIFPKNAKIKSVKVSNGTAFVDFDKNITKSFVGGSTGEEFLVNSIVKTLTEFSEVKQVRFLVEGAEIETLSGHMDLSVPIKKTDL